MFNVNPTKEADLRQRMAKLNLREKDFIEKFIKGSGKGGQKVNKTSNCVYLKHVPTGIEVRCHRERSQNVNRFLARRILCDRLENMIATSPSADTANTSNTAASAADGATDTTNIAGDNTDKDIRFTVIPDNDVTTRPPTESEKRIAKIRRQKKRRSRRSRQKKSHDSQQDTQ